MVVQSVVCQHDRCPVHCRLPTLLGLWWYPTPTMMPLTHGSVLLRLQAVAVVNRIRRAIADVSDRTVKRIGTVGAYYGEEFGVESWASQLFAEEVSCLAARLPPDAALHLQVLHAQQQLMQADR